MDGNNFTRRYVAMKKTRDGVYTVTLEGSEGKAEGVHFFDGKRGLVVLPNGKVERLPDWLKRRKRK